MIGAAILLSATAAALDVPGLAAEVIAATGGDASTRIEFRIISQADRSVNASDLFEGNGRDDRGTVAGVRAFVLPAGRALLLRRDARGRCRCSRSVGELLPRWHRDLEAEFAPVPPATRLRIEIPHFPPIETVALSPR